MKAFLFCKCKILCMNFGTRETQTQNIFDNVWCHEILLQAASKDHTEENEHDMYVMERKFSMLTEERKRVSIWIWVWEPLLKFLKSFSYWNSSGKGFEALNRMSLSVTRSIHWLQCRMTFDNRLVFVSALTYQNTLASFLANQVVYLTPVFPRRPLVATSLCFVEFWLAHLD